MIEKQVDHQRPGQSGGGTVEPEIEKTNTVELGRMSGITEEGGQAVSLPPADPVDALTFQRTLHDGAEGFVELRHLHPSGDEQLVQRSFRRLRAPTKWLMEEAEAGRLPCLRADRRLLFNAEAIERLLSQRAAQAKDVEKEDRP